MVMRRFAALLVPLVTACSTDRNARRTRFTIELSDPVQLSSTGDSVDLFSRTPAVADDGTIAAYEVNPPGGGVALFDSAGHYRQSISRQGRGPGEITQVISMGFGPGDTLWLVDGMFTAHSYLLYPTVRHVRTLSSARPIAGEPTRFGILTTAILTRAGVNAPALTHWTGSTSTSFGVTSPAEDAISLMGPVLIVDSSTIWRASGVDYSLELVRSGGTIVRRLVRNVPWFPPGGGASGFPWEVPPRPRIVDIETDAEGRLLILIRRASRNWKSGTVGRPESNRPIAPRNLPSLNVTEFFEGQIDVLDPFTGELLATKEVDGGMIGFPDARTLCEAQETQDGRVVLRLWRLALRP